MKRMNEHLAMMHETGAELELVKRMIASLKVKMQVWLRKTKFFPKTHRRSLHMTTSTTLPASRTSWEVRQTAVQRWSEDQQSKQNACDEDPSYCEATGMYGPDSSLKWGVPKNKDMKLHMTKVNLI